MIRDSGLREGDVLTGRLTTVAHNHDFGIDTVLVPGPPVRIHARIGGHRNGSRGKEGTRKRSAGKMRGRDKRRGGRERERRRKGRREKGREGVPRPREKSRRRGGKPQRRDPSRGIPITPIFVSLLPFRVLLQISSSPSFLPFCGTPYRLSSLPLTVFPIEGKKISSLKICNMSEWIHRPLLLCRLHRELKHYILPRQPAINGRK